MTNTESDREALASILHDMRAPARDLIALIRKMEAAYKDELNYIQQHRPGEQTGEIPSLDGLETKDMVELEVLKVRYQTALIAIRQRTEEVEAEVNEAERIRAQQNMTEIEALKRAVNYLAARVTKLEGERTGRLPGLPYTPRAEVPQFLGMPSGMGRHGVVGPAGSHGGVRRIGSNASNAEPDTVGPGFTRRDHPLNVIGGSGGQ